MPVLRQLFTKFRKRRLIHHLNSSEKHLAAGGPFTQSPLQPSSKDVESDLIPSPFSTASNLSPRADTKRESVSESKPSLTPSIASRSGRIGSSAERLHGIKDDQIVKARESNRKREEMYRSELTLGNPAVLGYSCDIEAGPPKLRT